MKYINIECSRFSCASSSYCREDHHIELVVDVDQGDVINQFTAKEIVDSFDIGSLLDEIGVLIALEHYAGHGNITMEDFRDILERSAISSPENH